MKVVVNSPSALDPNSHHTNSSLGSVKASEERPLCVAATAHRSHPRLTLKLLAQVQVSLCLLLETLHTHILQNAPPSWKHFSEKSCALFIFAPNYIVRKTEVTSKEIR